MAEVTEIVRYVGALGPVKLEFIKCKTNGPGDFVNTTLVRPVIVIAIKNHADSGTLAATILGKKVTISGFYAGSQFTKEVYLVVVGF